jgi:hypothetical protein
MSKTHHIPGQFAWRLIEMLESPAYRALSRAARQILDRIEIELAHHGGKDNGRLPITYDDFVAYGVNRHAIAPAIRELISLGFIEVTRQGSAGNADWHRPNLFRLTYRDCFGKKPTNEWRQITDAEVLAKRARQAPRNFPPVMETITRPQCRFPPNPVSETSTGPSVGNRHRKSKNAQKRPVSETDTTSRLALHLGPVFS